MAVSCIKTPCGEFYSITDSEIVHLLQNYIGYSGTTLRENAEKELCVAKLREQFDIFYKDIKRVLYDNFKVKKKIADYDDKWLASEVIKYSGGDDDNYFRNALIIILKILERTKIEIESYNDEMMVREIFGGEASFLHLLLFHIQEFVGEVASVKEQKNYSRCHSRKRLLAQEVFDLSRRIPKAQTYTNDVTHIYEVIFFLRQSIELKVLESLFIEGVVNQKYYRPIKVSADAFIKLLASPSVRQRDMNGKYNTIDVDFINIVHAWTNYFVHSGNGYWFWEVEFVRITLQDFILDDIEIDKKYLQEIPGKVLECIKDEERIDAKVIMSKRYYDLI